jgi:hypothetical protein
MLPRRPCAATNCHEDRDDAVAQGGQSVLVSPGCGGGCGFKSCQRHHRNEERAACYALATPLAPMRLHDVASKVVTPNHCTSPIDGRGHRAAGPRKQTTAQQQSPSRLAVLKTQLLAVVFLARVIWRTQFLAALPLCHSAPGCIDCEQNWICYLICNAKKKRREVVGFPTIPPTRRTLT